MADKTAPILELRGITKAFPGVVANDHIDLALYEGEILALLGENGAGKSTLMNILYGLYAPDTGQILIRGQEQAMTSPSQAIAQGIGMVHQHFMLVPTLTVTENVMLGNEPVVRGIFLDRRCVAQRIEEISATYGLQVPPEALVADLPVGVQQRVEIVKVLYRNADILILDEPTAVLTPQEVEDLFRIIRTLVERGKSVIFITHKLGEVLALADRIVVLRRGQVVGSALPGEIDEAGLASMMVGRDVELRVHKELAQPQDVVLRVQHLSALDARQHLAVDDVSFEVRRGEIVGVAGVQGNGQTELVAMLTGLLPALSGRMEVAGVDTSHASPRAITELGVAHVPEDRQLDGLVLSFAVSDNLVLNTYYLSPYATSVVLNRHVIEQVAHRLVSEFDVRTPGIETKVANLSGGNQQKVIVAREFNHLTKLLIAAQPTRGLDVGSIEYVHEQILKMRQEDRAVLLVSADLEELFLLADRIVVMHRGELVADKPVEQTSLEEIGYLMLEGKGKAQ